MNRFQSRPDGEWRQCPSCEKKGYGADSWHPATREFYPYIKGGVSFARCIASDCEKRNGKRGVFLPEIGAAA